MDPANLQAWFNHLHIVLEEACTSHEEPWQQSGMSGPEERWILLRRPIADCIDRSGTFLDFACLNSLFHPEGSCWWLRMAKGVRTLPREYFLVAIPPDLSLKD